MIKKAVIGKRNKRPLQVLWELNEFINKIAPPRSIRYKEAENIRLTVGRNQSRNRASQLDIKNSL